MKNDIVMPQMGESITNGTITKWHKQVGDTIEVDEILLEISTDKVESEIPSPFSGKIVEILFEEGETIDVGVKIAAIDDDVNAVVSATVSNAVNAAVNEAVTEAVSAPAPASAPTGNSDTLEDVVMPQMGESITNGTITKWHKQPGDMIEVDEILLEISTDKVESEIPSPYAGRVEQILFEEGETKPLYVRLCFGLV